jgi:hypothetical protein
MLCGRRASGQDGHSKPGSSFSFNNDIQVLSHIHRESPCLAEEAATVPGEEADDNNHSKQAEPRSERLRSTEPIKDLPQEGAERRVLKKPVVIRGHYLQAPTTPSVGQTKDSGRLLQPQMP